MTAFDLSGKVAMVTGAGTGLGLAIAQALAEAGATVALTGRTRKSLDEGVAAIKKAGGAALALAFDITDTAEASRAIQGVVSSHGRIDILVNNAGHRDRRDLFAFDQQDIDRLLAVDLLAPFHLSREVAKYMISFRYGRIINISSIASMLASAGNVPYTMAKGGLEALTRGLAAELGPHGITVNAIAPGFFVTKANANFVANPASHTMMKVRTSLGRWGQPEELAGAAVFLASREAGFITGQVLAVDGGHTTHF